MEVTINSSAKVQLSDTTIATLHTIYYGGSYKWSGLVLEITGKDELGLNVYKSVGDTIMSDPLKFWITPEEAIHDAIAQFFTESVPEDQAPDFTQDYDYPGQVDPTGWDAQDHKALYE